MCRVERAREQMRELVERGEMDVSDLHDIAAFHWAFDNDDDEDEGESEELDAPLTLTWSAYAGATGTARRTRHPFPGDAAPLANSR